jgi:hypothetical protein
MPGENALGAQSKLDNVVKQIEVYLENKRGLTQLKVHNYVEKYINMPQEEMRRLEQSECAEAGLILTRYAGYVQECYNKELSRLNWAEAEIRRAITPELNQYNKAYQTYEERKALAIAGNEYTARLEELRTWAQTLVDRLAFMAQRIDAIARAYFNLQQSKRKNNERNY